MPQGDGPEAEHRYAAAKDLADDIEHWLADEPVSAWPEPVTVKAGRWMRRHQALAAGVAALLATGLVALAISTMLVGDALHKEEQARKERSLAQVDALLNANAQAVPALLAGLEATRADVLPHLRALWAEQERPEQERPEARTRRGRVALALLPVEPPRIKDWLVAWMLRADDPGEMLLVRDALKPHAGELRAALWQLSDAAATRPEERFRALVALAAYDPENPRWRERARAVLEQLLTANPLHLGAWVEALRPVRAALVPPLAEVFRGTLLAEHKQLAATILADYAADQPKVLADLLLDADAKQFAAVFPVATSGPLVSPKARPLVDTLLTRELDKKPAIVAGHAAPAGPEILKAKATIGTDDPKVNSMPAKVFEVKLQAGKTYTLTMDSREVDSFLVLQDNTGKELASDDNSGGNLNAKLVYTASRADVYKVFAAALTGAGSFTLLIVEGDPTEPVKRLQEANENLAKRQANAAVALLKINQPARVWPLLKHCPDPSVRSYLIHRFGALGAEIGAIVKRLEEEPDMTIRRALILSLGAEEFAKEAWTPEAKKLLVQQVQQMYRTADDPGLHAAAEWLLRQWHEQAWLAQTDQQLSVSRKAKIENLPGGTSPARGRRWW